MTAMEARKLTDEALGTESGQIKGLVDTALFLVGQAARDGEGSVIDPCDRVHGVTHKQKLAAYERLRTLGYKVRDRQSGINESETVVSW